MTMGTALPPPEGAARSARPQPVQGRATFVKLRRSRLRYWSGPVRVQFLATRESDEARRVAFAVPRRVGTAVERNRFRRRMRAIASLTAASIPAGTYLVAVDQGVRDLRFQELEARMTEAMRRASQVGAR